MAFCRCFGKEIHESAPSCPHCGGLQQSLESQQSNREPNDGPLWMPITSLVLGIISTLALIDGSTWDKNQIIELGLFSIGGLTLGAISLSEQKTGKDMAISGVVMSAISLLIFIGMLPN